MPSDQKCRGQPSPRASGSHFLDRHAPIRLVADRLPTQRFFQRRPTLVAEH